MNINYVFFGTPEFAAMVLEKLIGAGYVPAAVVCNPDRPVGRKKIIASPPTKVIALKYNIPVLQPEDLSLSTFYILHSTFSLFIVAAYGKILPKEILDIPRLGVIGVHPSLLPKYRGPSPIQSTILNGEEKTGVTLYLLDEKMDHGPILANSKFQIPKSEITYAELHDRLAELGGELLIETLPEFLKGEIKPIPQNEAEATYTKKFTAEDAYVKPEDLEAAQSGNLNKAEEIERKIRALNPEPGSWTTTNGKRVKLLEAEIKNSKLVFKKVQVEGEKPKSA